MTFELDNLEETVAICQGYRLDFNLSKVASCLPDTYFNDYMDTKLFTEEREDGPGWVDSESRWAAET